MYLHLQKPAPTWIVIYTPEIHSSCNKFRNSVLYEVWEGSISIFWRGNGFSRFICGWDTTEGPKTNLNERVRDATIHTTTNHGEEGKD
jgi:hypothetical protein